MDILIVGKNSLMTDALINRMNKEGNSVFVLTGANSAQEKHRYVFEQYQIDYCSDSIHDVLCSVNPACIVYTGAYDAEFDWSRPGQEALRYVSACMNIALTASNLSVPHFILLSSSEVFEGDYAKRLDEKSSASPTTPKGLALLQAEKLCTDCARPDGMRTTILRLDNVYTAPFRLEDIRSRCTQMCCEALRTGAVLADGNVERSHLHLGDAVQAVWSVVSAPQVRHTLYHVSDQNPVSEVEIVQFIQSVDASIELNDNTDATRTHCVLDGRRFNEEFRFVPFTSFEKAVPEIYSAMNKHRNVFVEVTDSAPHLIQKLRRIWHTLLPYLENILALLLVAGIHMLWSDAAALQKIDLYLIYVLMFAVAYGKTQAIFSAFLSVAGAFVLHSRSGSGYIALESYVWTAELFILGMVVGDLKDQIKSGMQDKKDEIEYLSGRLSDVRAINSTNLEIKNVLKNQIIGYDDTMSTLYQMVGRLDKANYIDIMFDAAFVLRDLLRANNIAIYRGMRGGFSRLITATSEVSKKFGVTHDFEKNSVMYEAFTQHKVFVNAEANPELPVMALAMYSGDNIDLIFVIWDLRYEQVTLHESNTLRVLGLMIQDSVARSARYMDSIDSQTYPGCKRILTADAFREMVEVYRKAARQGLCESSVLLVDSNGQSISAMDEKLCRFSRESDCLGLSKEGQICILLANASVEEAGMAINRMRKNGVECVLVQNLDAVIEERG